MAPAKQRKNRAPLNLAMGIVGLVAIFALLANIALDGPTAINVVVVIALFISLPSMFLTRRSDEYTLALWSSGANAAFAVIVLWLFLAPSIEGMYDGITGGSKEMDVPTEGASAASILAFYLTFNIKRLTGAF